LVEYLSGNRIQGSSTLTESPPQTSWKESDRFKLSSADDEIDVSITPKDNIMILVSAIPSGDIEVGLQLGTGGTIDTGNNYAVRRSNNGATDAVSPTSGTTGRSNIDTNLVQTDAFSVMNIANVSGQEKLVIGNLVNRSTSGAGTSPDRVEFLGKWSNTNLINKIRIQQTTNGDFAQNSECVVLGCDNDEANSGTNFWQQLAYEPITSSASEITATIEAKKYLMYEFQALSSGASSGLDNVSFRFNGTGSSDNDYAYRFSNNYAVDGSPITNTNMLRFRSGGATAQDFFGYGFILNDSNREKLVHSEMMMNGGDGASANPRAASMAGKWASNDQITEIKLREEGSGAFLAGSYLRIWGAD